MIWPFRRRKQPQLPPLPPINEDWARGDLAECIAEGSWRNGSGPAQGAILRVTDVSEGYFSCTGEPAWGLLFHGWPKYYDARAFRKIHPQIDPCSAEFRDELAERIKRRRKVEAGT